MASTSLFLRFPLLLHQTPKSQSVNPQILPFNPKPAKILGLTLTRRSLPYRLPASADGVAVADLSEKDWSFLEGVGGDHLSRVLASGALSPESRVLAVTPTAAFVRVVVAAAPRGLVVAAHESLRVLAGIKEEHDEVRCFHLEGGGGGVGGGVVEAVPERFDAFNAVFVCYLPGMGISIAGLLKALVKRCSKGARLVIFLDQWRQNLEHHRREHPDVVTSDLPSRPSLQKAAAENKYQITEFVDGPTLYLAVLQFQG